MHVKKRTQKKLWTLLLMIQTNMASGEWYFSWYGASRSLVFFFFFLRLKTHRNIKPSVYMWSKIPDDQWPQCFPIALDFADIVKQKYEIIDFLDCWDDRRKIGITCIILTLPNFWNIGDHSRYYKTSISQSETSPILLARYLSLVA